MAASSWQERWRAGQIGFHQAHVEPSLEKFWPRLAVPVDAWTFVPLCGKSLDLTWLVGRSHKVLGIDLSSIAIESYLLENGIPARRKRQGNLDEYFAGDLRLLAGDLFELSMPLLGAAAAVYDRAALIALNSAARRRYAAQIASLTRTGTRTLLITLEYPQQQTAGPPFSVTQDEVRSLYAAGHRIELLEREDCLARDTRMRARGVTEMFQTCYLLERL